MDNEKVWAIVIALIVLFGIGTTYANGIAEINSNQAIATECVKNRMSWVPVTPGSDKFQCVPSRAE